MLHIHFVYVSVVSSAEKPITSSITVKKMSLHEGWECEQNDRDDDREINEHGNKATGTRWDGTK